MCDLCGTKEEKIAEMKRLDKFSNDLLKLHYKYSQLAFGNIKPHSDEWKNVGIQARYVLRQLVEDWV